MNGRRRLAELFGQWMERNGYTQTDVAAMGGPSTTTQTKVRQSDDPLSRQTLRQLDAVMGWGPGTAAGVLHGRYPEGVDDPAAEDVSAPGNTEATLLFARPEGLSDQAWDQIVTEAGGYIEWLIEKAARERQT